MNLWNYITMVTGISLLLALAGVNVAGISELLRVIGVSIGTTGITGFEFTSSELWNFIFSDTGILSSVAATGAIGIGLYVYTKDKAYLVLPIITGVWIYWISAMASIIGQLKDTPVFGTIIGVILIVLTIGFIQTCVDYFMQ